MSLIFSHSYFYFSLFLLFSHFILKDAEAAAGKFLWLSCALLSNILSSQIKTKIAFWLANNCFSTSPCMRRPLFPQPLDYKNLPTASAMVLLHLLLTLEEGWSGWMLVLCSISWQFWSCNDIFCAVNRCQGIQARWFGSRQAPRNNLHCRIPSCSLQK